MIRLLITISFIFGLFQVSTGQDLEEKVQFLTENTGTVKGKKRVYDQEFSQSTDHPYVVSVKITDTNSGNEIIKTVNTQDLNSSRVLFEPKKDIVQIIGQVKADKKLVKIVKDGQIQNYESKIIFYAAGIEEARALTDALKSLVEMADKKVEDEKSSGLNKRELLAYFEEATGNVVINDENYQQKFTYEEDNSNIIGVEIENVTKGIKEVFQVNAADLYHNRIDFGTKRNKVLIFLKTKADSRLISYVKDGEIGSYVNGFEIFMQSIEVARTYTSRLKEFVQISESEERTDFTSFSLNQCKDFLTQHIGKVVINQDAYEQSFTIDPENSLIFQIKSRDISKGEDLTYAVNAAYLHKGRTQFDTKRNAVLIELRTDNDRKLISTKIGEDAANYSNTVILRAQDIEAARDISEVFTRMKELAREEMDKQTAFSGIDQAERFIKESVGKLVINTDTYLQSIKLDNENICLYNYEFTNVSKDVQYNYEFNFLDIDVHKIQFNTKGNQAIVILEVRGRNKLIKTYKDGEMNKYVYQFQILAQDIEQARILVSAFKLKTESCEKE